MVQYNYIPFYSKPYFLNNSVADPHYFDAYPDPACHFDADPDPTFHFDADPDPSFHIKVQN